MRGVAFLIVIGAASVSALVAAQVAGIAGVENPNRAHINFVLKCQGCHGADAAGTLNGSPAMAGTVAKFLRVPEGREYLARVPGVATTALDNTQLAELLNWTLDRFDRENIPAGFKPYSADEIGLLRLRPLRTEAAAFRQRLVADPAFQHTGEQAPGH